MDINELTEKIIGCAYHVHNTLGSGFLGKIYKNHVNPVKNICSITSYVYECDLKTIRIKGLVI